MQIIQDGRDLTKEPPPWWVGEKVRCSNCGCTMLLEKGDPVSGAYYRTRRNTVSAWAKVTCVNSTCQKSIQFYMPEFDLAKPPVDPLERIVNWASALRRWFRRK